MTFGLRRGPNRRHILLDRHLRMILTVLNRPSPPIRGVMLDAAPVCRLSRLDRIASRHGRRAASGQGRHTRVERPACHSGIRRTASGRMEITRHAADRDKAAGGYQCPACPRLRYADRPVLDGAWHHTGVAEPDTVEEIDQFVSAGKAAMLYASNLPVSPSRIRALYGWIAHAQGLLPKNPPGRKPPTHHSADMSRRVHRKLRPAARRLPSS